MGITDKSEHFWSMVQDFEYYLEQNPDHVVSKLSLDALYLLVDRVEDQIARIESARGDY